MKAAEQTAPQGPQEDVSRVREPLRKSFNRGGVSPYPVTFGSTVCRAEHFILPLFSHWCDQLKLYPAIHRKLWELVFITHTLHEFGKLAPGMKGLGFGVGQEPLSTYFASRGVDVLASDLDTAEAQKAGWVHTGQHAATPDNLFWPGIIEREEFDSKVRFQVIDMNAIPADLRDFDFCWSACSLEHVGSIDKGLGFIENSLATLKPGGIAVHTTEFNLSSDDETLESGGTVLFRQQDIKLLARMLTIRGHTVLPLNFYPGATEIDEYVDVAPYGADPHLRLEIASYKCTSIGIAVVKG